MARALALILLACASLPAQQYRISTVAGEGTAGISFNNPTSVAVDAAGDLYVGDWSGFIRKIWTGRAGSILVAGTGITGFSGDGGLATNAMIDRGVRLAVDAAGNLYIAESGNNRIRKVDAASGMISTIAGTGSDLDSGDGGPAIEAGVARPTGVTLDREGNVYFSSSWSKIRKLTAATGQIETIAGQFGTSYGGDGGPALEALFWGPDPSAVNRAGDVYITDFENSRIRVVSAATKKVNTIVGSGPCEQAPPPFPVLVCRGSSTGDGGPATAATLHHAAAAALDEAGNLYIADTSGQRIRRVNAATGLIFTIAGTGRSGFSGDGGPARVAEISYPTSIAVDRSGVVYFADQGNQRIRVLTPLEPPAHPGGPRDPR